MTYNINIDDYIGRWGYSKQYIRNQLAGLKGKPVNVRISSLGGSVEHGLDIRQQFLDHGEVTAYLYGLVASSATIAALGAKKVCISKYCMFLVHKVSNWVDAWGQMNADQIQQLIDFSGSEVQQLQKMLLFHGDCLLTAPWPGRSSGARTWDC